MLAKQPLFVPFKPLDILVAFKGAVSTILPKISMPKYASAYK